MTQVRRSKIIKNVVGSQLRKKLLTVAAVLAALFCQLLVFGPVEVFKLNSSEFMISLYRFWGAIAFGSFSFFAILLIGLSLLPNRIFSITVTLLLGLSTVLYIQSTVFLWDYGHFDGSAIDWSRYNFHGIFELVVWVLVPYSMLRLRGRLEAHIPLIAGLLLAIQVSSILISTQTHREIWRHENLQINMEEASFSKEKNLIFILLDGFQSTIFSEAQAREDPVLSEFDGFTFFPDHLGLYETTYLSLPALMSGQVYSGQERIDNYLPRSLRESLPEKLSSIGYDSFVATLPRYCNFFQNANCQSFQSQAFLKTSYPAEVAFLADLTLFRHAPHLFKPRLFNHQAWFLREMTLDRLRTEPTNERNKLIAWHEAALSMVDFFTQSAKANNKAPSFKFIHLMLPHTPMRLNQNCETADFRETSATNQAYQQSVCSLLLTKKILNTLKKIGVYDKSVIFVLSDHGLGLPSEQIKAEALERQTLAFPLLLIKPMNQRGGIKMSSAPSWLPDIPNTASSLLGEQLSFPHKNTFEIDEKTKRRRLYFDITESGPRVWTPAYLTMQEYKVEGKILDPKSWSK